MARVTSQYPRMPRRSRLQSCSSFARVSVSRASSVFPSKQAVLARTSASGRRGSLLQPTPIQIPRSAALVHRLMTFIRHDPLSVQCKLRLLRVDCGAQPLLREWIPRWRGSIFISMLICDELKFCWTALSARRCSPARSPAYRRER